MSSNTNTIPAPTQNSGNGTFLIVWSVSFGHLLNDMMQALMPAVYPMLETKFQLSFMQVGIITLVYQMTASILQPFIGHYTDKKPMPYSLPVGMVFSMIGLILLAYATSYSGLLLGGFTLGIGSSIFHPESSRIARLASGGRHGLAQSIFQVGGNLGTAIGPLAVAFIVLPIGQEGLAWFTITAIVGMILLSVVGHWYKVNGHAQPRPVGTITRHKTLTRQQVTIAVTILFALLFSKYIYLASFTSYYQFYLIQKFAITMQNAQVYQFVFFGCVAAGTILGGPIGDRYGRKFVIWFSILGALPFTLALPHVGLEATVVLTAFIGLIMSSAFPAIVVYGQELMPGRVGMVSGLFFGFMFGIGGIGAALLGGLADIKGLNFVFLICSFLPAIGLLALRLPNLRQNQQ